MKKRIVAYFWVGIFALLLSSCNDDDNDSFNSMKSISIHGLNYTLDEGVIWHGDNNSVVTYKDYIFTDTYINEDSVQVSDEIRGFSVDGQVNKTGNFIVSLYEKGMYYDKDLDNTYGRGAIITIHFASPSTEKFEPGTYTFNQNRAKNTFIAYSSSEYDLNETETYDVPQANIISDGTIIVGKNGEVYTIDVNCTTSIGSKVKARFIGKLENVNIKKEESVTYLKDVTIDGAFDTLKYTLNTGYGNPYIYEKPDYYYCSCIFNSSMGISMSVNSGMDLSEMNKKDIDLALCFDKINNSVFFESPIRMRAKMWHGQYKIGSGFLDPRFPCHTKIANAPTNFTVSDFDAIKTVEDFDFTVEEDLSKIPLDTELPRIVLFETGNGVKGAIKITKIKAIGERIVDDYGWIYTYPTNPQVEFEIKTPISPSSAKLK